MSVEYGLFPVVLILLTIIYLIFGTTALTINYNDSFWLVDNGNGGFVGQTIKENIYYFSPIIENQYISYFLIFFTIILFTKIGISALIVSAFKILFRLVV